LRPWRLRVNCSSRETGSCFSRFESSLEDLQGVAQPAKQSRGDDLLIGKRQQTLPQRKQMGRKVPAVTVDTYRGGSGFRDRVSYQL